VRRGPRATDPEIRPDAELTINGARYFLELDRGTMGFRSSAAASRTMSG
jgi:hypothetical protein